MYSNEIVTRRRPVGPPPLALRLAAVLAVPLVLYALVATGQKALDNYRLNKEADALRAEVVALRNHNIELQQQIEDARTDVAIERIAREQLGLVKPGDKPLVLTGDAASTSTLGRTVDPEPNGTWAQGQKALPASSSPTPPPEGPVWRQWWDYFFG
jgi:cell division protein FtsB